MSNKNEAVQPNVKTNIEFVPTRTFKSKEFGTEYIQGMAYHVREGNDKLAAFALVLVDVGMATLQESNRN